MNIRKFGGIEGGFTLCVDKFGFENVLVVAKATFDIRSDGSCVLAEKQQPITVADEHYGDPETSSVRYECDFSTRKLLADVVVNGSAHAPGSKPSTEVHIGLLLGSIRKVIRVVGDRVWEPSMIGGYQPSAPQPFMKMPIVYERAFGGADISHENPRKHVYERRNLFGISCFARESSEVLGTKIPNLEHPNHPIKAYTDRPPPVGLGFVSRNWEPRLFHAGTYDQDWLDDQFPFLPTDFEDLYFQGAPEDQRCPYLHGGERVALANMTPEGSLDFVVPRIPVSMYLVLRSGYQQFEPKLDTLIIEPDTRRCILVWRASEKLTWKLTDIYEVWVGAPSAGQLTAMRKEKRYIERMEKSA